MKKFLILTLVLLLLLPLALPISAAEPTADEAEAALLYCFHTDSVLFTQNADTPIATGNTAQLMTALLVLEAYPDLMTNVTLTEDLLPGWYAPGDYRTLADYGFHKGKTLPVKDLLAAMVIENANCASLLLASLVSGSRAAFVEAMNNRAASLGMQNTVYKNPTGEDAEGAVTTASDLLPLAKLLYQNPDFMALASAAYYDMQSSDFRIYTRNYMIGKWYTSTYLYASADGMKAGYTDNSGNTLVATSTEANGYSYLAVVLGGKDLNFQNMSYSLAEELFHFGSTAFSYREVLSSAKLITTLPINKGEGITKISLFPKEAINAYLPKSAKESELTVSYSVIRESLDAPFEKGTPVGEVTVSYQGAVIGRTELVTGNGAKRAQNAALTDRLSTVVKPLLILLGIVLSLIAIKLFVSRYHKKQDQA